jgi:type IV pilus assembly protein PilW
LKPSFPSVPRRAAGFSLVEIMVGMVIGMFGIIIMMQVFSLAEGQKRATTSGGDAQTSGAIALYGLQRDIRQAGLGISDTKIAACNLLLRAGVTLNVMAPVTINHASIPAGDANTDTVLVVYGSGNGTPQGDGITAQPAGTSYTVQTPSSFVIGDKIIAAPKVRTAPCNLTLDSVANIASPNVSVTTGVASMAGGTLFNLGQSPKVLAYAIRSGNLTMCDYTANDCGAAGSTGSSTVWVPIASNVVSMRAQYARDTNAPMDAIVDTYNQTALATACDTAKVSAIRLALVVRSATFEKTFVTGAAPTWEGSTVQTATAPTNPTAVLIDLSGFGTTWQNYRYRVFQSTVPLRNIAWQGVASGC